MASSHRIYITSVNWNYAIGVIYGEHPLAKQEEVYNEITAFNVSLNISMLIIRDFNQVTCLSKRKGHIRRNLRISVFNDWINQNALIDSSLNGIKFTWNRGNMHSRMERCLCDAQWLHEFPSIVLSVVKILYPIIRYSC